MQTKFGIKTIGMAVWILLLSSGARAGAGVGVGISAPEAKTTDLKWMSGAWVLHDNETLMEAFYTQPNGGLIMGVTKLGDANAVHFYEFETIRERENTLVLQPYPDAKKGVEFPLVEISNKKAVFENLTHDFPQKVIFESRIPENMIVRIEGSVNGKNIVEEFHYTKSKNE